MLNRMSCSSVPIPPLDQKKVVTRKINTSFVAKGDNGIHAHGAARGDIRREKRDSAKHEGHHGKRQRISGLYTK